MAKNNIRNLLYMTARQAEEVFGLHHTTMKGRDCEISRIKDADNYLVADVLDKCFDLIAEKRSDAAVDLKAEKTAQEIRKLKIENDMKEGVLVLAADVEEGYLRRAREVVDVLDTMLMEIKKRDPDIPQSTLDTVNIVMTEVRNRAF